MLTFLALTRAACRRPFPRHLLHRITTPAIFVVAVLASQLIYTQAVNARSPNRPNFVFILADDMGYDSVSALNDHCGLPTPHLDRLVREGMHFTDAHSGSAVCSPTRYGLLTGRYSWRSSLKRGIVGQWKPPLIKEGRLTVGGMLQQTGYHTACIGKWHLGWHWHDRDGNTTTSAQAVDYTKRVTGGPIQRGFHYYYGDDVPNWPPYVWLENDRTLGIPSVAKPKTMFGSPGLMMPDWKLEAVLPQITKRSVEYIQQRAKERNRPFFLYFPLTSPHTPIAPSAEFKGKSGKGDYADFLMETDWAVGEVLRALDQHGLAKDTLVIFTADNGTSPKCQFESLEQHGVRLREHFRGHKADIYEGGHRVPFVARWPEVIAAGSRCNQVIWLGDFMATVAEIIGHELPADAAEDSVSLLSALKGQRTSTDKPLHEAVVHHSISGHFAIRQGRWKLAFCRGSAGWSDPKEAAAAKMGLPDRQLFDLASDPKEQHNVQADHPQVVQQMTELLQAIVNQGRSTPGPRQRNDGPAWWAQLPWPAPARPAEAFHGAVIGQDPDGVRLPAKDNFHLFLLVGQSNMAGRGRVEEQDRQPHARVLMLTQENDWKGAVDPLHFDKPQVVGVGLGRTFGIQIAQAKPKIVVGLIPCAVGGSPISSWQPGGYHQQTRSHPYDDTLRRAKFALRFGELKGILWHQGESDSVPEKADVYETELHALIARLRKELNAPNVPFVAGQMGRFAERPWSAAKTQVDAAHQNLPNKVPHTAFVPSHGLKHKGDEVHFDAASYRELGRRYAKAFLKLTDR